MDNAFDGSSMAVDASIILPVFRAVRGYIRLGLSTSAKLEKTVSRSEMITPYESSDQRT